MLYNKTFDVEALHHADETIIATTRCAMKAIYFEKCKNNTTRVKESVQNRRRRTIVEKAAKIHRVQRGVPGHSKSR